MEGLLDFVLRDILTRCGGIDRCVSEFIRVSNTQLPPRVFERIVPELLNAGRTFAGVPVRPQLLGSDPSCLADNAAVLASLGPFGVDLNFGCPAKVVNRHGGGAALLEDPELLTRIMLAVRRAVPAHMPVSAKMRLGLYDDRRAEECALALQDGGAQELVVHARTKADAYRPPAYWERIADIRAVVKIPVIANGEIWNVQDAQRCRALSGCHALMLGRGMVTDPGLALAIVAQGTGPADANAAPQIAWPSLVPLMADFWQLVRTRLDRKKQAGRLKQWLNFLRQRYPQAQQAYAELRTVNDPLQIDAWMARQTALGAYGAPGATDALATVAA
ncbi:MAG: tRNA-dihydrouridine synthase [Rhodoferax sp.]|nr:tRNA-dihydrouridine synthase [Rhodoferax sp.]